MYPSCFLFVLLLFIFLYRIMHVLRLWLSYHHDDFENGDGSLRSKLEEFLDRIEEWVFYKFHSTLKIRIQQSLLYNLCNNCYWANHIYRHSDFNTCARQLRAILHGERNVSKRATLLKQTPQPIIPSGGKVFVSFFTAQMWKDEYNGAPCLLCLCGCVCVCV